MNSKLKITLQALVGVVAIVISFGSGFYRGYLSSSKASLGFELRSSETLYDDLDRKDSDALQRSLQVMVLDEAKTIHLIKSNPTAYFLRASSHANAGNDLMGPLQKADALINDKHLEQTVSTAIPAH